MKKAQLPVWVTECRDGVILSLHIQPKASCSEIVGEYGEGESVHLKLRVAPTPVDGAANEELLRFLKKTLRIPASRIHILRGETSKSKDMLIQGCSAWAIVPKLSHSK